MTRLMVQLWLMLALAIAPAALLARQIPLDAAGAQTGLKRVPLSIRTHTGVVRFTVEVAGSFEEQEHGMMFRGAAPPNTGMIFPMLPPRIANFWMKNTLIPLDLIFIRADGSIARIAAQATPLSLAPIGSGEPVAAVLEIAGGRAAAAGIAPGDRVKW